MARSFILKKRRLSGFGCRSIMRLNKLPSWSGRTLHFYLEFTPNSMPSSATSQHFWGSVPCISHWLYPEVPGSPSFYRDVRERIPFLWFPEYGSAYIDDCWFQKMRGTSDDPPRWRHGYRAACLRSYTRFVGFRLGLATIIHAASDCRGIYPLSLPLIEWPFDQTNNVGIAPLLSYPDSNRKRHLQRVMCYRYTIAQNAGLSRLSDAFA